MASFVRSRWMKIKMRRDKEGSAEAQRDRIRRAKLKISLARKRSTRQKTASVIFFCDGRLQALCHMTYPSYRARRDTSIHLFRHLTCLERGTKRRGEERSLPVMRPLCWLWSSATLCWHTWQCANKPDTLFYTISPFYDVLHTHVHAHKSRKSMLELLATSKMEGSTWKAIQ